MTQLNIDFPFTDLRRSLYIYFKLDIVTNHFFRTNNLVQKCKRLAYHCDDFVVQFAALTLQNNIIADADSAGKTSKWVSKTDPYQVKLN